MRFCFLALMVEYWGLAVEETERTQKQGLGGGNSNGPKTRYNHTPCQSHPRSSTYPTRRLNSNAHLVTTIPLPRLKSLPTSHLQAPRGVETPPSPAISAPLK